VHFCASPGGEYGYLKAAAAEAVAGRAVLAHSYIAAYALQWGKRRRYAGLPFLPNSPFYHLSGDFCSS
jgi:hypothetical protein